MTGMTSPSKLVPSPFSAAERDLLRRELCRHFGQDPVIADGIFGRFERVVPANGVAARKLLSPPSSSGRGRQSAPGVVTGKTMKVRVI
jgi:hypothetical protein